MKYFGLVALLLLPIILFSNAYADSITVGISDEGRTQGDTASGTVCWSDSVKYHDSNYVTMTRIDLTAGRCMGMYFNFPVDAIPDGAIVQSASASYSIWVPQVAGVEISCDWKHLNFPAGNNVPTVQALLGDVGAVTDVLQNDPTCENGVGDYTVNFNTGDFQTLLESDINGDNTVSLGVFFSDIVRDSTRRDMMFVSDTTTLTIVYQGPPIITLNGDNPQNINQGTGYVELGAITQDSSPITIDASEFVDTLGSYSIYYDSSNSVGNAIQMIRTVNVVDVSAPVITLNAPNPQLIDQETPYNELGATCIDDVDGDISGSIVIDSSSVNTAIPEIYQVTYDCIDAAANAAAQEIRTVEVLIDYQIQLDEHASQIATLQNATAQNTADISSLQSIIDSLILHFQNFLNDVT